MNNNFRIGWAAVSDRVGRWNTFQGLTFLAIPIFALSPFLINNCVLDPTGYYPKGAARGYYAEGAISPFTTHPYYTLKDVFAKKLKEV